MAALQTSVIDQAHLQHRLYPEVAWSDSIIPRVLWNARKPLRAAYTPSWTLPAVVLTWGRCSFCVSGGSVPLTVFDHISSLHRRYYCVSRTSGNQRDSHRIGVRHVLVGKYFFSFVHHRKYATLNTAYTYWCRLDSWLGPAFICRNIRTLSVQYYTSFAFRRLLFLFIFDLQCFTRQMVYTCFPRYRGHTNSSCIHVAPFRVVELVHPNRVRVWNTMSNTCM